MDDALVAEIGDALDAVRLTGIPIAPPTEAHPDLTVEDAYRIQLHQIAERERAGRSVIGFKVGLTSRAMQRMLGIDSPDFGHLLDDMVITHGAQVDAARFIAPRVEPEIAFVLSADLTGPNLTRDDVVRAVAGAVPAIELIDSRIADWRIGLADTIADNASSGAVIAGTDPVPLDGLDLRLIGCVVRRNDEIVATGAGAAVLGDPVEGLRWLANRLGSLGRTLPAGSLVRAGAMCAAVPVVPGDRISATFARFGSLDIDFASAPAPRGERVPA